MKVKIPIQFSVTFRTYVEIDADIYNSKNEEEIENAVDEEVWDIDIPESDTVKYVECSLNVEEIEEKEEEENAL